MSIIKLLFNYCAMSSNNEAPEPTELHVFQTQKQPIKRNNMSIVDMNRSKIKFLTKALSKSEMTTYPSVSTAASVVYNNNSNAYNTTVHVGVNAGQYHSQPHHQDNSSSQQYNLQFRMKEKFEDMYKKILRISKNMGHDQIKGRFEKRFIIGPNEEITNTTNNNSNTKYNTNGRKAQNLQQQLIRLGYRPRQKPSKSMLSSSMPQNSFGEPTPLISSCSAASPTLEINTTGPQLSEEPSIRILGHTRYKPRLISISKPMKMSNNIKDYLSVEKIRLKDLEDSIVEKHNIVVQKSKGAKARASLYCELTGQMIAASDAIIKANALLPTIGQIEAKVSNAMATKYMSMAVRTTIKKFTVPFETYYYRDFLWRVAYSNEKILQFPLQYESKLKVYIGRGNNSRLVRSIITRRNWYQVTDRIEQACFVWTQIKVQSVFNSQLQDSKTKFKNKVIDRSLYVQEGVQKQKMYIEGSIWTEREDKAFRKYFMTNKGSESRSSENMKHRNKAMPRIWEKQKKLTNSSIKQSQNGLEASSSVCSMPSIHPHATNASTTLPLSVSVSTSNLSLLKPKLHNHLPNSYVIGNKKALFQTMSDYYEKRGDDVFNYLPMTFHICEGLEDAKYFKFLNYYYAIAKSSANNTQNSNTINHDASNQEQQQKQKQKQQDSVRTSDTPLIMSNNNSNSKFNAWIVKPGENTNRGQGITVCLTLQSIKSILKRKDKHHDGSNKTYIVQKYIEKPLLYRRRKFDLRHYIMINCSNGFIKGYFFKEGYVRTTSSEYTLKQGTGSVHLTNDAVQKNLADYGRYEKGNKISYDELDNYIGKGSFYDKVYPQMKKIATDVICASAPYLDPQKMTNFEIYGMDFMIDEQLKVWLIEVNTNPCLELSCPLLAKIIPKMIEQTLKIVLDPYYSPPVCNFSSKSSTFTGNTVQEMEYELVYDDRLEINPEDAKLENNRILNDQSLKKDEDDCYEDDGEDWNEDA